MPQDRRPAAAPEHFIVRRNASGAERYYWRAPARLAPLLAGSPFAPLARLPDDRAAAEEQCRAISAQVKAYIAAATAPVPDATPAGTAPAAAPGSAAAWRATPGLIAHAIVQYRLGPAYRAVAPATKVQYDWIFARIEEWGGWMRIERITYEKVVAAATALADRPRKQQLFLQLLAMLVDREGMMRAGRGLGAGEMIANPVRLVLSEMDFGEPEGGWVWPRASIPLFVAAADALGRPSIGTAIVVNEWIAQRMGDLIALPRLALRDGVLHVVQNKTNQYVPLPLGAIAHLGARVEWQLEQEARRLRDKDAARAAAAGPNVTPLNARAAAAKLLICETTERPWNKRHFQDEFSRIRAALAGAPEAAPADIETLAAAGIHPVGGWRIDAVPRRLWSAMAEGNAAALHVETEALQFMHLRHTGITRLKQAGCDDAQIRSISGHTSPATVYAHYLAVTEETARAAFEKRKVFEAGGMK